MSPCKKRQVKMFLEQSALKTVEIAKTLNVSTGTVDRIKKKLRNNEDLKAKTAGKCGRNRNTIPRLDRKTIKMYLSDRRSLCGKVLSGMAAQGFVLHRKTVNRRLCEVGLKPTDPERNLV